MRTDYYDEDGLACEYDDVDLEYLEGIQNPKEEYHE